MKLHININVKLHIANVLVCMYFIKGRATLHALLAVPAYMTPPCNFMFLLCVDVLGLCSCFFLNYINKFELI